VRAFNSVETVPITFAPRCLVHQQPSHPAHSRVNQHETAGNRLPEFVDKVVCGHALQRERRAFLECKFVGFAWAMMPQEITSKLSATILQLAQELSRFLRFDIRQEIRSRT